jgi:hypothetical protein
MSASITLKNYCMKELYHLNKDNWYVIDDKGKKIANRPWQEFYCPLHKRSHRNDKKYVS